jgi:predicted protein tyrosine phosphatase
MQFIVEGRQGVERGIVVRVPYIVISIHDPGKRPARIRRTAGLRGILYLSFHDAEPTTSMRLPDSIKLMTAADAERIWGFVQEHLPEIGAIVCHCEQGMSRSPAVAAALAEALGEDPAPIERWTQPNQTVYQLLKSTITRLQETAP